MTNKTRIALHTLSITLMVITINLLYWISKEFAHYLFWFIGCFAFGWWWKQFTDLLIEAYDETNT